MRGSSIRRGTSFPLGASVQHDGVNFSVYSRNATLVELLLFDGMDAIEPALVIPLEPGNIEPIITGTFSLLIWRQARCTVSEPPARSIPSEACDSMATKCCSIGTAVRSPSRRDMAASVIMPPPQ